MSAAKQTPESADSVARHSLRAAAGSGDWYHCDRALMPKIGRVVEAQDGTLVFWGGVNWWAAEKWETRKVTKYRYLPNSMFGTKSQV
jgi:hypothetical protein